MLVYRDGKLYAGKSFFSIPNDCKINDAPLSTYPNGINLTDEGEEVLIDVNFEFGLGGAKKSLEESLLLGEYQKVKIKARPFPGGTAWCAEYRGDLYSYFEAKFDAATGLLDSLGREINTFRILVTAPLNSNLRFLRHSSIVSGLLESFNNKM